MNFCPKRRAWARAIRFDNTGTRMDTDFVGASVNFGEGVWVHRSGIGSVPDEADPRTFLICVHPYRYPETFSSAAQNLATKKRKGHKDNRFRLCVLCAFSRLSNLVAAGGGHRPPLQRPRNLWAKADVFGRGAWLRGAGSWYWPAARQGPLLQARATRSAAEGQEPPPFPVRREAP